MIGSNVLIAALAALATPALAQGPGDQLVCAKGDIAACGRAIAAPGLDASSLARLYETRGRLQDRARRADLAIADFTRALERDPGLTRALVGRAVAHEHRGEIDAAAADLTAALELEPQNSEARLDRANVALMRGDRNAALSDLEKAIASDPGNAHAYYARAVVRDIDDDSAGAIGDLDKAMALDAKLAVSALTERGEIRAGLGDRAGARDDFSAALQRDPAAAGALIDRGYIAYAEGDLAAAARDLARGLAIGAPRFVGPEAARFLFLARARAGRPDASLLESAAADGEGGAWPSPLAEFLKGDRSPEALLAAAVKPAWRCEAQFTIGEWRLAQGQEARDSIAAAAAACPKALADGWAARAELARMTR